MFTTCPIPNRACLLIAIMTYKCIQLRLVSSRQPKFKLIYHSYAKIRKFSWFMTRKLSDTLSRKFFPFFRNGFAKECEDRLCELLLCRVVAIVGDTLVHDRPQTLNGVKVRAIWRQLDEVDPALWPCKEVPDIRPSVVGGVYPR